jgi:pimeloyl-ACP methyl ester carboxylesterase
MIGMSEAVVDMEIVPAPRLVRREIVLDDGHRVGIATGPDGGMPLVLIHGLAGEGIVYAQTLSRLVRLGFMVVAVDMAGHGGTEGLPRGGGHLASYSTLLGRVLDRLEIPQAVLAGHSMGGRIVTQLAASEPERAVALVLIDACVGDTWDRLIAVSRVVPPFLGGLGVVSAADTLTTVPLLRNRLQARKLGRLAAPTVAANARRPWRALGPIVSMLRSGPSRPILEELAARRIPLVAIHGNRDLVVPYRTARDAVQAADGWLVSVHGATHSWLLKDPETLPAILGDLLAGPALKSVRDQMVKGEKGHVAQGWNGAPRPRYRWTITPAHDL